MITTATEFERLVLDRLKTVIAESGSDAIDLRQAMAGCGPVTINLSLYCSLSEQTRQAFITETLPLLFGAAWKILDLTIELALSVSGEKPSKQNNWRISEKTSKATAGIIPLSLLTNALLLWRALCAIYQATAEHRHCMVQRQASFSGTPLALHGHAKDGHALKPLTATEIAAFIKAAQLLGRGVTHGGIDNRSADYLRYEFDQLRSHTNLQNLSGVKANKPVLVKALAIDLDGGKLQIDIPYILENAHKRSPGCHFDLQVELPVKIGATLVGRLEDFPTELTCVDLLALPDYLKHQ